MTGSKGGNQESQTSAGEPKTRKLADWIEGFLDYTEDAASPPIFRLWSAITCLSAALERRVWTTTNSGDLFAHVFVWLVAPPGVGKGQAIFPTESLWHKAKGTVLGRMKVAPRSMSRASFVDELVDAQRAVAANKFPGQSDSTDILEYAALAVAAEELGVLISAHDLDFLSVLSAIYNGLPNYTERKRGNNLKNNIINPHITFLAGTQPAFLASLLPEEAWGQGMMSRIIMVYSGQAVEVPIFGRPAGQDVKKKALEACLLSDLSQVLDLLGQLKWTPEAEHELQRWRSAGMEPVPQHSKLTHYNTRRILHVIKLAMIASVSRGNDLEVTLQDLSRSRDWLLEAELAMPDIFREMVGKSDAQIINELAFGVFAAWTRSGKKPVHETFIYHFLSTRAPSDRIPRILDLALRANYLARVAGTRDQYVPRPKNEHGME